MTTDMFNQAEAKPQRMTLPQQALAQFLQVLALGRVDPGNHDLICDVITELLAEASVAVPDWYRPVLQCAEDVARYRAGRKDRSMGSRDWFAVSAPLTRAMHDFAWRRGAEAHDALRAQQSREKESSHAA